MLLAMLPATAKDKPEWRDWPLGERLIVAVGLYKPQIKTDVVISDSAGNIGTVISFENTLGMDKNKSTSFGYAEWRVTKRNSIWLSYFELNRSSGQAFGTTIRVGDREINTTLPVASFFDVTAVEINYAYSFIFTPKNSLAVGIGLGLQDVELGIKGNENCGLPVCPEVTRNLDTGLPLPTLKIRWSHAFTDKWILDTNAGWLAAEFALDDNEDLKGKILNAGAQLRRKIGRHFGVFGGYRYFYVDLGYDKRDLVSTLDYQYQGFTIGLEGHF